MAERVAPAESAALEARAVPVNQRVQAGAVVRAAAVVGVPVVSGANPANAAPTVPSLSSAGLPLSGTRSWR